MILSCNLNSIFDILLEFNISRIGAQLLRKSLNLYVKGSDKMLIK
jgi:hypothetical protein